MNNLLYRFTTFVKKVNLFQRHDKLLIAVSGGVDSVVLCDLCYEAAYDFAIAHCNFQLREEESVRDETFVSELAKKYSVPIFSKRFETVQYAEEKKVSIQVAARELRYEWFRQLANKKNDYGHVYNQVVILTAHHANDNIETVLMNFFKGTGINGLKGIAPKQDKLVRPLLFATKEELIHYADEKKLAYVQDSSNESDKYTRNYLRNQLIPAVAKVYPMVEQNLQHNIDKFREIAMLYEQSIELHKSKLVKKVKNEVHLPVMKLQKTEALSTIMYEILKAFGFASAQVIEVMQLLKSETGKLVQSASHRVIRNRDWLIISPLDTTRAQNIIIEKEDRECLFDNHKLSIKEHVNKADFISANEHTACIDTDKIVYPLLLRKCKTGDYFYPLGMQKKKKLSKFFSDQKLSLTDKEKIWVLESDKRIMWVVGMRIDDRFKVTENTKTVLKMVVG